MRPTSHSIVSSPHPAVLAIGGLDPSGGAGILLDAAVIRAVGAHPLAVATTLTAQSGVRFVASWPASPTQVEQSLALLLEDAPIAAVKTGALGNRELVEVVTRALRSAPSSPPLVVDPVLASTTSGQLLDVSGTQALLADLLPLAQLVTPNRRELEQLTGRSVRDRESATVAAGQLLETGCGAVLVKGGHFGGEVALDLLVRPEGVTSFEGPRFAVGEVRGTGCALASAIAAYLGLGEELDVAVRLAKALVARGIEQSISLGPGARVFDGF